jgi:hypothetical protein
MTDVADDEMHKSLDFGFLHFWSVETYTVETVNDGVVKTDHLHCLEIVNVFWVTLRHRWRIDRVRFDLLWRKLCNY